MSTKHLFVYGTLKTYGDEPRSPLMAWGEVGPHIPAVVYGYTLYLPEHRAYPMAFTDDTLTEDRKIVQGEVVELDNPTRMLELLDMYEGVSRGLYRRELTEAYLENGERVDAYIYVATIETIEESRATPIGTFWSRAAFPRASR
jgi:gamma-glutamylcyclotransferase (GGCT)/AIG2-like uncharacterized protein YtfP